MAYERLNLEATQNAAILHEARQALRSGEVSVPDPDFNPIPLLPEGLRAVSQIEHSYHKRQLELKKSGVNLFPRVFYKI